MSDARIRVIDFETTGMEPPAQVCEVGVCDLDMIEGVWTVGAPRAFLCGVNAMPPEVRAVHHITLAECTGRAPFSPAGLWDANRDDRAAILAAHNMDFEQKFFGGEAQTPLLCTLKAALRVWPDAPAHSNSTLRYWLEDQGKLSLDHATAMPPHRAGPDAYVTAHILKALLEAGVTGREMVAWTHEPRLLPTCPIGKFRGQPWAQVEAGFLSWMLNQASMEEDLKWNARRELERRRSA